MRPRKCRLVRSSPLSRFYKPRGVPMRALKTVSLKDEEWEAIQLADYRGLDQTAAAERMGVSRPTFSRVLADARAAVAKALVEGAALEIGCGDFRFVAGGEDAASGHSEEKGKTMKLAFTASGDDLAAAMDPRFGRAAKFLIYDLETDGFAVAANDAAAAAQGAGIKAAEIVAGLGVGAVVTGECGPNAVRALAAAGIEVYSTKAETVGEALALYRAGKLSAFGPA